MLQKTRDRKWPSGGSKALMTVIIRDREVEEITGQYLIEGNEIGLGKWVSLGGDLPSGQPIEFLKYLKSQNPDEYVINIDIGANVSELSREILYQLKIAKEKICWQREEH